MSLHVPPVDGSDLYGLLGVDPCASPQEVRAAYRKMARLLHPDVNPDVNAGKKFRDIARAYAVLKDPVARMSYDEVRRGGGGLLSGVPQDLSLFQEAFRRRDPWAPVARPGEAGRGKDFLASVTVGLETAVKGGVVPFLLTSEGPCDRCGGQGMADGTVPPVCDACSGSGWTVQGEDAARCAVCGGEGSVVTDPCGSCAGSGVTILTRTVGVDLPSGIVDGARVKVSGAGGASRQGGAAGDLYVDVKVAPHPVFARHGCDLHVSVAMPLKVAVSGGYVVVPLLVDGAVRLRVPSGTVPGQVFRLRGRGLPVPDGDGVGDLLVKVMLRSEGKDS